MTGYNPGDVVLVYFIFSDESGMKKRPGLVVSSNQFNNQRNELIIAAITGQIEKLRFGDCLVKDYKKAGLLHPSAVTGVIRTIKSGMVYKLLGKFSSLDIQASYYNISNNLNLPVD
jgi:mRNA interferase MazF